MKSRGRPDLAIEQKVLRGFKALPKPPRRILLAVSGGVDSIVMAEILWKWRRGLGLDLAIAHVHHGKTNGRLQAKYRQQAQSLVKTWAEEHGLAFFSNLEHSNQLLRSEEELRDFRMAQLEEWRQEGGFDAIALGQHQDDLLETRLIRLIRGSGLQGLRAMGLYHHKKLRPLLGLTAEEIRIYAKISSLRWLEDPSNKQNYALRNWIRGAWLPALESRRPGARRALARSLESLLPAPHDFKIAPYVGLRRDLFATIPTPEQRELVARYLGALGLRGYASTHVDEILKRLSTRRKNFTFEMLGMKFEISADYLWASRV